MNGEKKYIPSEFDNVDKVNIEFIFDEKLIKERKTFFVDLPMKNEDQSEMFMWAGYLKPGR